MSLQSEVKPRFLANVKRCFSLPTMENDSDDLSTVGGRLKAALVAAGKIQRDLSTHFNISEQAVSQWFRDITTPDAGKMFELSKLLGVQTEWLIKGTGPRKVPAVQNDSTIRTKVTTQEINPQQWARDVPIVGGAACGEDGMFELNGQTIGFAKRPPNIIGSKDVYALYVRGESMAPWRENGGLVYVHPHLPVRVNDYVVVQLHPIGPDATPAAYIKRLVRRTADHLILLQYNPGEELRLATKKVKAIHRILNWDELLEG